MEFLKKLGREVFERVVLSHRSTLTSLGLGAAILVADQVAQALGASHQSWAQVVAGLVTLAGASLKSKKIAADAAAATSIGASVAGFRSPGRPLARRAPFTSAVVVADGSDAAEGVCASWHAPAAGVLRPRGHAVARPTDRAGAPRRAEFVEAPW